MVQSIKQNRAWIAIFVMLSAVLLVSPQAFSKTLTVQFTNTLRVGVQQLTKDVGAVNWKTEDFVKVLPPNGAYVVPGEVSGGEGIQAPECSGGIGGTAASCHYEVTYTYAVKDRFACSIILRIDATSKYKPAAPYVPIQLDVLDKQCTNYSPDVKVQLYVDEHQNTDTSDTLKFSLVNCA